jgi:hypothetical protein
LETDCSSRTQRGVAPKRSKKKGDQGNSPPDERIPRGIEEKGNPAESINDVSSIAREINRGG